jgi:hypothetical protein
MESSSYIITSLPSQKACHVIRKLIHMQHLLSLFAIDLPHRLVFMAAPLLGMVIIDLLPCSSEYPVNSFPCKLPPMEPTRKRQSSHSSATKNKRYESREFPPSLRRWTHAIDWSRRGWGAHVTRTQPQTPRPYFKHCAPR